MAAEHKNRPKLVRALGGDETVLKSIEDKKALCAKLEAHLQPLMQAYYSTTSMAFTGSQFDCFVERTSDFEHQSLLILAVTHLQDADVIDALVRCNFSAAEIRGAEQKAAEAGDYMNAAKLRLAANHKENPGLTPSGFYYYFDSQDDASLEDAAFLYYKELTQRPQKYTHGMIVEHQSSQGYVAPFLTGGDIRHWYVFAPYKPDAKMDVCSPGGKSKNGIYDNPNIALADACMGNRRIEFCNTSIPAQTGGKLDTAAMVVTGAVIRGGLTTGAGQIAGEPMAAVSYAGLASATAGIHDGVYGDGNNHTQLSRVIGAAVGGVAGFCVGAPVVGMMLGDAVGKSVGIMINLESPDIIKETFKNIDGTLCTMIVLEGVRMMLPVQARGFLYIATGLAAGTLGSMQSIQKGKIGETVATLLTTAGATFALGYGASLHILELTTVTEAIGRGWTALGLQQMSAGPLFCAALKGVALPFRGAKHWWNRAPVVNHPQRPLPAPVSPVPQEPPTSSHEPPVESDRHQGGEEDPISELLRFREERAEEDMEASEEEISYLSGTPSEPESMEDEEENTRVLRPRPPKMTQQQKDDAYRSLTMERTQRRKT
ncbi:hypothetical protein M3P05_01035 [Sansalvadorimonas sp. 2012CJ34-2]|uniref:Uncharacterized protein n=1 Tax=Parendozoicomonas callyspongiae TaxID=2942213 RepID=A0ABT0PBB1_9GAMM|nr:hypothetical protein [Sansalvadorimonas sp. 2012CJ34-2]MCL6268536.1 hypothetical protein [Sansalvadorimonas sp. 2012CJ34-2]